MFAAMNSTATSASAAPAPSSPASARYSRIKRIDDIINAVRPSEVAAKRSTRRGCVRKTRCRWRAIASVIDSGARRAFYKRARGAAIGGPRPGQARARDVRRPWHGGCSPLGADERRTCARGGVPMRARRARSISDLAFGVLVVSGVLGIAPPTPAEPLHAELADVAARASDYPTLSHGRQSAKVVFVTGVVDAIDKD